MTHGADDTQVPLSNRRGTPPFFGVDRLSVSFPLRSWESDPSAWSRSSTTRPGTPNSVTSLGHVVKVEEGVSIFIGLQEVPATGQTWGKIEFNPSRIIDPEGTSLCPPSRVREVAVDAVDFALSLLEPAVPDVGAMNVRRLDVARDFQNVTRPAYLVQGLGPVHRPWARRNLVHYDPGKNGAQTLMVGSGAGVVRLYDKDQESGGKAPGVLRWEVEARRDWCQKYGNIKTVADATDERVESLGRNRWEWSQMGTEVTAMESVVEKVMRSGLSFAEQRGLIGYLTMIAAGADVRAANSTHSKYRRLSRQIGVSIDPGSLSGESPGFRAHLDLEQGCEVVGV